MAKVVLPLPRSAHYLSQRSGSSATLEVIGKPAALQAKEHNIDGLVEAVVALCSEQ